VTRTERGAAPHPHGGRGARDRILVSARTLFYRNGIHRTGVELIAEHAHVSKRTLYQHFPSKDDLAAAYLRDIVDSGGARPAKNLGTADGPARDRLLSIFDIGGEGRFRGCPFHNAAVEAADGMAEVQRIVHDYKFDFLDRLTRTAAEAGAADPAALGRQLAVLLEGATALAASIDDTAPLRDARSVAKVLVDAACPAQS
jgi:AcrR family transcriptional regulator